MTERRRSEVPYSTLGFKTQPEPDPELEPSNALRYEIICGSGDRAQAETPDAALLAAATLADDAANGIAGAQRIWRKQIVITRDGTYDGQLTMAARRGERSSQ